MAAENGIRMAAAAIVPVAIVVQAGSKLADSMTSAIPVVISIRDKNFVTSLDMFRAPDLRAKEPFVRVWFFMLLRLTKEAYVNTSIISFRRSLCVFGGCIITLPFCVEL